jgi:hypothetical protein
VFSAAVPQPGAAAVADWRALLAFGTVLDEGEDLTSPRVVDAAGPGAVVMYHATYERGGASAVDGLPGGQAWREAIEAYIPRASATSRSTKDTWSRRTPATSPTSLISSPSPAQWR